VTPVQAAVAEYIEHGWKLCRIQPGQKSPRDKEWNAPGHEIRVPEAFKIGWGVGLLHLYSGTCCIDIDHYGEAYKFLESRGIDLDAIYNDDFSVRIVSGRPNRGKLLYRLTEPLIHVTCAPYDTGEKTDEGKAIIGKALELRCASARGTSTQDVLPPSVNPKSGQAYRWDGGILGDWRTLPELPASLQALWEELSRPASRDPGNQIAVGGQPAQAGDPKIEAWLAEQRDYSYDGWLDVGMRLHAAFQGDQAGLALWDRWAMKDPTSYHKPDGANRTGLAVLHAKWHSFKLSGAVKGLDAELRSMPAAADEFAQTEPEPAKPAPTTAVPDAAAEIVQASLGAAERQNIELLRQVVLLTGEDKAPYYIQPGHGERKIALAAGRSGVQQSAGQFNRLFSPYMQPMQVSKSGVPIFTKPAEYFERASWRDEAHSVGFRPSPTAFYNDYGKRFVNCYRPVQLRPLAPPPQHRATIEWLFGRIKTETDGTPLFARYLHALYAFCLLNPGRKVRWAPLLWSSQTGTGKSTLMRRIPEILFGREYVRQVETKHLESEFTGDLFHNSWWMAVEELRMNGSKRDAKEMFNMVKTWITEDALPVRRMYMPHYQMTNFLQVTATSNFPDALFLEDGANGADHDRRWLVGEVINERLTEAELYMLDPVFGTPEVQHPDAERWLQWYFIDYAERVFKDAPLNPNAPPPTTEAKREMLESGRGGWEDHMITRKRREQSPFDKDIITPDDVKDCMLPASVTTGQAVELLRKFGGSLWRGHGRTSFSRNVFVWRNRREWDGSSEGELREYVRTGVRPGDPARWGEACRQEDPLLQ
jgi:hypothetical protein